MRTPWGELKSLNLNDIELCGEILSTDKHQLIEGLVIERFYDKLLRSVGEISNTYLLDIDSAVAIHDGKYHIFILARELNSQLRKLFELLGKTMTTHIVQYINGDLFCCRVANGKKVTEIIELGVFLEMYYGSSIIDFKVNLNVRDEGRQKDAFFDHLLGVYGTSLGEQVVLPRLFINHAIQRHFRAVWNLDRIVIIGDDYWVMEVKHKYPIMSGIGLKFGLNVGEVGVLSAVVDCGIRCLHSVVVKPIWSKDVGSMYIMKDKTLRDRTMLLACELDSRMFDWINSSATGISAAHTSITGTGQLKYKSIPVEGFNEIGIISEPMNKLADSLVSVLSGGGAIAESSKILSLKVS